eukprot:RCo031404
MPSWLFWLLLPLHGVIRLLLAVVVFGVVLPLAWVVRSAWRGLTLRPCRNRTREELEPEDLMFVGQRSVIHSVMVTDAITLAELKVLLSCTLVHARDEAGQLRFPRFTMRVVSSCLGSYWVEDKGFDLAQHVFPAAGLNSPATEADVCAAVGRLMATPLHPQRPLWEFQLVERYCDSQPGLFNEGKDLCSVVIIRIHHSIGDGVGLMQAVLQMMTVAPTAVPGLPLDPTLRQPAPRRGSIVTSPPATPLIPVGYRPRYHGLQRALGVLWNGPWDVAAHALSRWDSHAMHLKGCRGGRGSLQGPAVVSISRQISLADLKKIKNSLGISVNDVVLAA